MDNTTEVNLSEATAIAADYFKAGKFSDSEHLFRQILSHDGSNMMAAEGLAVSLIELERSVEALPIIDAMANTLVSALSNLAFNRGRALCDLGRCEEALAAFERILTQSPGHIPAATNRGLTLVQMGQYREAIAQFDAILSVVPDHGLARFGRGYAKLVMGHYKQGFADYECRAKDDIEKPSAPMWMGEPLEGKTLLVIGEHKLGDNIMFARYLPTLAEKAKHVLYWTPEQTRPLFRHLPVELLDGERANWPACDYWVWSMSLAHRMGTTTETVPPPVPLSFSVFEIAEWQNYINDGAKLKVGLCWSGSASSQNDAQRSIPAKQIVDLVAACPKDQYQFYSLQLDVRESDRIAFDTMHRYGVIHLLPNLRSMQDTANAIKNMDVVLTVDTSVAHLAGTVGIPTIVLLSAFRPYWVWSQASHWYASANVIKQTKTGDWTGALSDARVLLHNLATRKLV